MIKILKILIALAGFIALFFSIPIPFLKIIDTSEISTTFIDFTFVAFGALYIFIKAVDAADSSHWNFGYCISINCNKGNLFL